MVYKVIAIVLALLVIVGMVSCAADKKEDTDEEQQTDVSEDPDRNGLTEEEAAEIADCFVRAMFSPDIVLLTERIHPQMLRHMNKISGQTDEGLSDAIANANAQVKEAWNTLGGETTYDDLDHAYTMYGANATQLDTLNAAYTEAELLVDSAAYLNITVSCNGEDYSPFTICIVKIDEQWWIDPTQTVL